MIGKDRNCTCILKLVVCRDNALLLSYLPISRRGGQPEVMDMKPYENIRKLRLLNDQVSMKKGFHLHANSELQLLSLNSCCL